MCARQAVVKTGNHHEYRQDRRTDHRTHTMKRGPANNCGRPHVHQRDVAPAPADGALPLEAVCSGRGGQGKGRAGRVGAGAWGRAGEGAWGKAGEGAWGRAGEGAWGTQVHLFSRARGMPPQDLCIALAVCYTSIETIERQNHL